MDEERKSFRYHGHPPYVQKAAEALGVTDPTFVQSATNTAHRLTRAGQDAVAIEQARESSRPAYLEQIARRRLAAQVEAKALEELEAEIAGAYGLDVPALDDLRGEAPPSPEDRAKDAEARAQALEEANATLTRKLEKLERAKEAEAAKDTDVEHADVDKASTGAVDAMREEQKESGRPQGTPETHAEGEPPPATPFEETGSHVIQSDDPAAKKTDEDREHAVREPGEPHHEGGARTFLGNLMGRPGERDDPEGVEPSDPDDKPKKRRR
jgi:hypothetical protein